MFYTALLTGFFTGFNNAPSFFEGEEKSELISESEEESKPNELKFFAGDDFTLASSLVSKKNRIWQILFATAATKTFHSQALKFYILYQSLKLDC